MKKLLKIGLFGLAIGAGALLIKTLLDTSDEDEETEDEEFEADDYIESKKEAEASVEE